MPGRYVHAKRQGSRLLSAGQTAARPRPHLLWGDAGRQIRQEGGLGGAAVGLCARDGVFVDGAACGGVKMLSVSWTARWGGVAEARHAGM